MQLGQLVLHCCTDQVAIPSIYIDICLLYCTHSSLTLNTKPVSSLLSIYVGW